MVRARRNSQAVAPAAKQGSQTQRHSEISTSSPCLPKKTRKLRGETRMGRQSRKYRALSKGHSAATPSPPLVMASSRIWLAHSRQAHAEGRRAGTAQPGGQGSAEQPHEQRKEQRMGKAPVPQQIRVTDTQLEADHIQIRKNGAEHAEKQQTRGNDAGAQGRRQGQHGRGMGKHGGHGTSSGA